MVVNSEVLWKFDITLNSTASNTGATGENIVELSTGNTVVWGKHETKPLDFVAIPYPDALWDGVLGLSLLKQFVVELNYDDMHVYLYDKKRYKSTASNKVILTYAHGVPVVKAMVKTADQKTRSLRLEIDTGSDRILDISTHIVNTHHLLKFYPKPFAKSTVMSSDGNSGDIINDFFPMVELGGFEFYKIPGGLAQVPNGILNKPDIDGMLGNWFLKRFNLTFDFENDYLYLRPNNYVHSAYYEFLTR